MASLPVRITVFAGEMSAKLSAAKVSASVKKTTTKTELYTLFQL